LQYLGSIMGRLSGGGGAAQNLPCVTRSPVGPHSKWASDSGGHEGKAGVGVDLAADQCHLVQPRAQQFLKFPLPAPWAPPSRLQNLRIEVQLSASTWPLLQRLQRQFQQQQQPSAAPVTLLAQLVHGSSTTRGRLAVELTAAGGAATQQLAATQVQLHFGAAPPLDEAAAAKLGGGLEVAASRAPSAAGLANLLAACMWCQADGSGGLALQGLAAAPAPIIDFKPLLAKRVVSQPLPNRLAAGLLRSPPAAAPALEVRQAGIAVLCTPPSTHGHSSRHRVAALSISRPCRMVSSPWTVPDRWCHCLPLTQLPTAHPWWAAGWRPQPTSGTRWWPQHARGLCAGR
jgi:hypothetical protein